MLRTEPAPDAAAEDDAAEFTDPRWSRHGSLTFRILAVNVFALGLLTASIFYLDSFRARLIDERETQAGDEATIIASAAASLPADDQAALLADIGVRQNSRLRLYDKDGTLRTDSFRLAPPSYRLRTPDEELWRKHAARLLDKTIEAIAGAPPFPDFAEPARDTAKAWPEVAAAAKSGKAVTRIRFAPDRTLVLSAAVPSGSDGAVLLTTSNARDITRIVRAERANLGFVIGLVTMLSILLSLFLARTIVNPLRQLADAAIRVRLGRAREVTVPRLPDRSDEIGLLARALSDMSNVLRQKMDSSEQFAADVSHELKNPLASLRSAIEGMGRIDDPALRAQLLALAEHDVMRLDRLITDISEASRVDAQLARTRFVPVDLGPMIETLVNEREKRGLNAGRRIAYARPRRQVAVVMGEGSRLERVINNLLDNAVSFSPANGLIEVQATRIDDVVSVRVMDHGPGVPEGEREEIFHRFHSVRPADEDFGQHSGLGLAISRSIIQAHQGSLTVCDREDGGKGACFRIELPAAWLTEAAD